MIPRKLFFLVVVLFCTAFLNVFAYQMQINITGEIYIPVCRINNDSDITISFKEMSLKDVNGENNAVSKTIPVNCDVYEGTPYIYLSGGTGPLTGAPDNVLATQGENSASLGVALYQGNSVNHDAPLNIRGCALKQNSSQCKINHGLSNKNAAISNFTFTAVPYKHGKAALVTGDFSSSVLMNISYH